MISSSCHVCPTSSAILNSLPTCFQPGQNLPFYLGFDLEFKWHPCERILQIHHSNYIFTEVMESIMIPDLKGGGHSQVLLCTHTCARMHSYVFLNSLFLKALTVVEMIHIIFYLYELWRYIEHCFNLEHRI